MRSLCLAFYLAWALFRSSFAWRFPPRRPRQHWMLQEHRSWYSTLAQGGSLSKLNAMHPEISPGESGDNVESDVAPTEYLPVVAEGGEHLGQVADASTAGETVATLESQRQPWWEDERRTEGIPTLTPTTQWRMTLSLKVCNSLSTSYHVTAEAHSSDSYPSLGSSCQYFNDVIGGRGT